MADVDENLKAKEIKPVSIFEESVFIQINLADSDSILVGLIYISPSSVAPLEHFRDTLHEIGNMGLYVYMSW